jgi:hypothetical protein
MKQHKYIGIFVVVMLIASMSGCSKKTEKDKYIDVMKKVIELYKSDELVKADPMAQQKLIQDKMKVIFDASGLELGKTLEEQSNALQALDTKYKDDPDVKKVTEEVQKAGEELGRKMMEKMNQNQQTMPPADQQAPPAEEPAKTPAH